MTTITRNLVRANGIDLHLVEAGAADAPALLLLHGGFVSTNPIWDSVPFAIRVQRACRGTRSVPSDRTG